LIVRVQCGGHGGQAGHQRINRRRGVVEAGAVPEELNLSSLANDVSATPPLDQRCLAHHQAIVGNGRAKVIWTDFTQSPNAKHKALSHKEGRLSMK
jgi:hypothetical protein